VQEVQYTSPNFIIPVAAITIYFFLWTYVFAQRRRSILNLAYLCFITQPLLWAIGALVVWISSDLDKVQIIQRINAVWWQGVGFFFLNFIYTYIEKKRKAFFWIQLGVYIVGCIVGLTTKGIVAGTEVFIWGKDVLAGPLFMPAALVNVILPISSAMYYLWRYQRTAKTPRLKSQCILILYGSTITFILAIFSDAILPEVFHYTKHPQLAFAMISIQSFFIFVAIIRYNLMTITISDIAKNLFANAREGFIVLDMDGIILHINPAAQDIFGCSADDVQGKSVGEIVEEYPIQHDFWDKEIVYDNNSKTLSLSQSTVIRNNTPVAKILFLRDITHRKLLEKLEIEQKRLSAVKEMGGMIAHEFSQPLTVIQVTADEMLEMENSSIQKMGKAIDEGCHRITGLIEQVRTISEVVLKDYVGDVQIVDIQRSSHTSSDDT